MISLPDVEPVLDPFSRIAFYGPMCVGKTHLAKVLQSYDYIKLAFADKLKDLSRELFQVQGKDGEARKFYQDFGTAMRNLDLNVWVYPVIKEIHDEPLTRFVVDDLRMISEAEALKKAGFLLIRVDTHEKIRQRRIKTLYPNTLTESHLHSSELEWKEIEPDAVVYSNNHSDVQDMLGWLL